MVARTVALAAAAPVSAHAHRALVASRRTPVHPTRNLSVAAVSVDAPASSTVLTSLKGVELKRAADGTTVDAADIVPTTGRVIVPFLTQFADFDSWELAQRIADDLPRLEEAGVQVVAVGIGSVDAAKFFCEKTKFPIEKLYADETGGAYDALKFEPGFGRTGGEFGWIQEKVPSINGYVKLLVMCAGIGSPGTLAAVFGGYLGGKNKPQLFVEGSNYDNPVIRQMMDVTLGKDYQRPFELATLRLTNMISILSDWDSLAPSDDQLLVQRGGSIIFEDGVEKFRHDDAGILGYCPVDRLVGKALSPDPSAAPDPIPTIRQAGKDKSVFVDDVYASIAALEKRKVPKGELKVASADLNGKWRLVYTGGTKKVAANLNKAGFGGSYFPVSAIQSFDIENQRIRNGIYLGPINFFFDGPFIWREKLSMLEFTFTKVSLQLGNANPVEFDIDDGKWDAVKVAEQQASDGGGKIENGDKKAAKPGANPFFKFVFADDAVIAARGRGGGLALWAKEGEPETDANDAK